MKYVRALLLLILPAASFAQGAPRPDIVSPLLSYLEAGVICAPPTTGELVAPGTVAGTTHLITQEPPFVSVSRRVPAVLGIGFGVKAQAEDLIGMSDVTMQITHPAMGDFAATMQTFQTAIRGTDPSLTFYQFDFDYELLPGIWQMEASHEGKVIYRTTFEVLSPKLVPELAAVCGFTELLS